MASQTSFGVLGYPDHSGSGDVNFDSLVAGGGIYIFNDGTTLTFSASGPFITYYSTPEIIGSKNLVAGTNIQIIEDSTSVTIVGSSSGSGAPTSASYVTISTEPSLSAERRLAVGSGLTLLDNGANSTVDLGLATSLTNATFITVGPETLLTGERRLTVEGGLGIYDSGANSTITVTASALQYTGTTSTSSTVNLTEHSTRVQLADCTSNNITYNLPVAASTQDKIFIFKKIDASANTVTLDPSGAETIDGATTYTIPIRYMTIGIYCDSVAWYII